MRPQIIPLGREFRPRERQMVKLAVPEGQGRLWDSVGIEDTEGTIRYGVIEGIEFGVVPVRRWGLFRREKTERRIWVRFEKRLRC
jgi:hypothetical protein